MKLRWTPEAEWDRREIWDFIAAENAEAAARMDLLFANAVQKLADFPELGRVGKIAGTREVFPHENYRLVYEIGAGSIWILALVHTSRLWPPVQE